MLIRIPVRVTRPAWVLGLALLTGCSTNPVTGRDQFVDVPAIQAHADIGFELSRSARGLSASEQCDAICQAADKQFAAQVERTGKALDEAARGMSPELYERIGSFRIDIDPELGMSTASSASGRIVLGSAIARLEPNDDVTAFLIAREMAHVIARHDEEDSGARIIFSALTALLPFTLIARFVASTLGAGAMVSSWAEQQRREADEIAIALLVRIGRPVATVAGSLVNGLQKDRLTEDDWTTRYIESAARIAAVADSAPKYASFDEWLARKSVLRIERISTCLRSGAAGQSREAILARRRECMEGSA